MHTVETEQHEQARRAMEENHQRILEIDLEERRVRETVLLKAKEERRKAKEVRAQQRAAQEEDHLQKLHLYEEKKRAYQLQVQKEKNVKKLSKAVWMWKLPRKSSGTGRKTQLYLVLVHQAYHVCWVSRSPTKDSKFPLVHGTEMLLGQEAERLLSAKRKQWLHRLPEKDFAIALRNPDGTILFLVCTREAEHELWSGVLRDILSS
jgi:hypothetical protein